MERQSMEYKTVKFELTSGKELHEISNESLREMLIDFLNKHGDDGWVLCCMISDKEFIFMRPK